MIALHSEGKHPFIVQMYASFVDTCRICVVMDFAIGCDLITYLTSRRQDAKFTSRKLRCELDEAAVVIAEIAIGLDHMHSKQIVYRDLKTENVLVAGDGHILLADFGIATYYEDDVKKKGKQKNREVPPFPHPISFNSVS